jgi:hypothetical protein
MDHHNLILLISLEYLSPIFSGNGQYARSIVRGLLQQGNNVCIVSGRRENVPFNSSDAPGTTIIDVPIPVEKWGRLDRSGAWSEFASGCSSDRVVTAVQGFFQDGLKTSSVMSSVMVVDWSAFPAWQTLQGFLQRQSLQSQMQPSLWLSVRTCYLNFRIFTTSTDLHRPIESTTGEEESGGDLGFYQRMEIRAIRGTTVSVALCRRDALHLAALGLGVCPNSSNLIYSKISSQEQVLPDFPLTPRFPDVKIVLPPLRGDLAKLAQSSSKISEWNSKQIGYEDPAVTETLQKCLITSVVRLSREKNTHVFAEVVHNLSEFLQARGLRPFLCGSAPDLEYATSVRTIISDSHPTPLLVSAFLGTSDMAAIFSRSCINIHPALYDAYGMTIVEAAAMGTPSIVHTTLNEKSAHAAALFDYSNLGAPILNHGRCLQLIQNQNRTEEDLGKKLVENSNALPTVGALDLLAADPKNAAVFLVDLSGSAHNIAKQVREILSNAEGLKLMSVLARERALLWREEDNGKALSKIAFGLNII